MGWRNVVTELYNIFVKLFDMPYVQFKTDCSLDDKKYSFIDTMGTSRTAGGNIH